MRTVADIFLFVLGIFAPVGITMLIAFTEQVLAKGKVSQVTRTSC